MRKLGSRSSISIEIMLETLHICRFAETFLVLTL